MKCINNNKHIQKNKKIAYYWQRYKYCIKWRRYSSLSLNTGPVRTGHVKIAIDVTVVDVDLFFFTLPVQ